jgi:hypothetical protein
MCFSHANGHMSILYINCIKFPTKQFVRNFCHKKYVEDIYMYHFPKSFTEYIFVVINHNNLSIFTLLKCIIIKCNGVLECVILWVSFNSYSTYVLKALLLIIMYNNNKKKIKFWHSFCVHFC